MIYLAIIATIGAIFITLGLLGLYLGLNQRVADIERSLKTVNAEVTDHKRDISILQKRDMNKSDKVYIVTDGPDVSFPSKGGF